MDKFSIDDVREIFRSDIGSQLERVEQAAHALLAWPTLTLAPDIDATREESPLATAHGAVAQLERLGLQLENLDAVLKHVKDHALQGVDAADQVAMVLPRLQALAIGCVEGAGAMRHALELELAEQQLESQQLSQTICDRLAHLDEIFGADLPPADRSQLRQDQPKVIFGDPLEAAIGSVGLIRKRADEWLASTLFDTGAVAVTTGHGFDAIRDAAHAVHGTASLVGANGLVLIATTINQLAHRGLAALEQLLRDIGTLRRHAELLGSVSPLLEDALLLAWDGRSSEAAETMDRVADLLEQWHEEQHAAPALAFDFSAGSEIDVHRGECAADEPIRFDSELEDPAPSGFAFGDEPEEDPLLLFDGNDEGDWPAPEAASDAEVAAFNPFADEEDLEAVFRQEAREYVVALQGYIQTLVQDPGNGATAKDLERVFHTIKGASATVGLSEVSGLARDLQFHMDRAIAANLIQEAGFLVDLVVRTNRLLAAMELPPIDPQIASPLPVPAIPSSDLCGLLAEEAAGIFSQIEAALPAIVDAAGDMSLEQRADSARSDIARSLHRLKGSAILSSAGRLAEHAAALHELCQSESATSALRELIAEGVRRLRQLLAESVAVSASPHAQERNVAPPPTEDVLGVEAEPPSLIGMPRPKLVLPPTPTPLPRELPEEDGLVDAVWEAFEMETAELLESIERALYRLEGAQQPKSVLAELLRLYHTLKGGVNTVGLRPLGKLLHDVEDTVESLIEAMILPPLDAVVTLLLDVHRDTKHYLQRARRGQHQADFGRLQIALAAMKVGDETSQASSTATGTGRSSARSGSGSGDESSSSSSSERRAESAYVRVPAERLNALMTLTGELLVSRSRLGRRATSLHALQREMKQARTRMLSLIDDFRERYEFTTHAQFGALGRQIESRLAVGGGNVVAFTQTGFTDLELDSYGEVNILARRLHEVGARIADLQTQVGRVLDGFSEDNDAFSAIVSSLQGEITRARMVPIDGLFLRLRMPARDAAQRESKQLRIVTAGGEVSLDKTIIDKLYTPMLHLVRNAVAHGIESPTQRLRARKDATGVITLSARQESGHIVMEVQDDGAGLDLPKLKELAVKAGVIEPDTPLDHPAIKDVIFLPGLSTRAVADDISGRGVGCDVVRREIEKLGGHVRVDAAPGSGTRFVIQLPLTLAITRALLVENRGSTLAIPLNFAERILAPDEIATVESAGVKRILLDGAYHSLISFDELLQLDRGDDLEAARRPVVLLRAGDQRVALQVDRVVAQEEIVVKSLDDMAQGHPIFSGVTITGDGELLLIVDVPSLLEKEVRQTPTLVAPLAISVDEPSAASLDEATPVSDARATPAPSGPMSVLFIDDSLSVRKVAEKFLTALKCEVSLAVDGEDALAQLASKRFDLVFTDLEMPRLNGFGLIEQIRRNASWKALPVVVVTSRSGQKHRDQAFQLGATDYLTKPFTQALLEEMLRQWARREVSV